MAKERNVFVYHPTIVSDENLEFKDILLSIGESADPFRFELDNHTYYSLKIENCSNLIIITLQMLTDKDLPYIANMSDGGNEKQIEIGEDEALSYKNIFVYDPTSNKLFEVKITNCPKVGRLKLCLQDLYSQTISSSVRIRFGAVMSNNLIDLLKHAKSITSATITSLDYRGDQVNESELKKYKDYLGGQDHTKTTKIKGKKGANIKHIISNFLDDAISGYDIDSLFSISMDIDGRHVNFNKYYRQIPISISDDPKNKKCIDYADLREKLQEVAKNYKDEE